VSGSFVAVLVPLPVDVESTLLLLSLLCRLLICQEEHEHLLALHFLFGDAVRVVAEVSGAGGRCAGIVVGVGIAVGGGGVHVPNVVLVEARGLVSRGSAGFCGLKC